MEGAPEKPQGIIGLRAVGLVPVSLLTYLTIPIEQAFRRLVRVDSALADPSYAFNRGRRQYSAQLINQRLHSTKLLDEERTLGVTARDLYIPELSFVFGLADPDAGVAVISLARLDPRFYGEPPNDQLFQERAIKEALHELGHTFGLSHCPDPLCVMHFSNTIHDTDIKQARFCPHCGIP